MSQSEAGKLEALQVLGMSLIKATPNTDQLSMQCRVGHL